MTASLATREEIERREHDWLAPQATFSSVHWERPVEEAPDAFRTCFVRDRDRVLHCGAFRRLKDKTQVFVIDEGDFYRTRLTHTLEVAQISRYLCRALRLNEALGEVLALVHDIGHPPFGHEGERILHRLAGPFDHNRQALRIVDVLEAPYLDRPGLNLTQMVRRMILKHGGEAGRGAPPTRGHVPEAQVTDVADRTAYQHHDLEDGLRADILHLDELDELSIWRQAVETLSPAPPPGEQGMRAVLNHMLKTSLADLLENSRRQLGACPRHTAEQVAAEGRRLVRHGERRAEQHDELGRFLLERYYRHPRVLRSAELAQQALVTIVEHLRGHPEEMPPAYRRRADEQGISRSVCDYVGGMTDRYAIELSRRLQQRRTAVGAPRAATSDAPRAPGTAALADAPAEEAARDGHASGAMRRATATATLDAELLPRVEALERVLGYAFADRTLAATALTHASARTEQRPPNERLEFLGDSILGMVVGEELYTRFPDQSEGELSRMRSSIVSRHALRSVAARWGLQSLLLLGPGFPDPAQAPASLAGDGVEAVLGALYLDGGLAAVRRVVLADFAALLAGAAEGQRHRNDKSELQAFTQGRLGGTPHYRILSEEGPDHRKSFTVAAILDGVELAAASGRNKRQAEQRAAREALALLKAAAEGEAPLPPGLAFTGGGTGGTGDPAGADRTGHGPTAACEAPDDAPAPRGAHGGAPLAGAARDAMPRDRDGEDEGGGHA